MTADEFVKSLVRDEGAPTPPARPEAPDPSPPLRRAGLIAGLALLIMSGLAGYAKFMVIDRLVTPRDATQTAADVMASAGTFRAGVGCLVLVVVLDVVVAWALFRFFSPVSRDVSRLTAWFRILYAGIFLVAISHLVNVLPLLLVASSRTTAFSPEQVQEQALSEITTFQNIWSAGLMLFGVHLVLLGYLAYVSGFVPKALSVLVTVAGLGYAVDSFGAIVVEDYSVSVGSGTFVGEFLLAIWLVIRGRRTTVRAATTVDNANVSN